MIKSSKKFMKYFQELYEANCSSIFVGKDFEEIFESNKSRIEYINKLFEEYNNRNLNHRGIDIFEETIDFIYSFINGKEKGSNVTVPKQYFEDKSTCSIVPSLDEMNFLLKLIDNNKVMFEMIYENNPLYLKLPDESFNENMTRILEIKKHNIAHLLGLTEYEDINSLDPSKNLLKKHFNNIVKDKSLYKGSTESEKLLEWMTSKEGKEELLRIHKLTLDFIQKDKKENPNSYEGDNLKSDKNTVIKFKERYKKYTGLDYPIINYSRLMVKSINVLNFLKLNNVVEIILDYNAPQGKNNEKDIFLVNRNSKKISDKNNKFLDLRTDLLIDFYRYAYEDENEELKNKLLNNGINVNSKSIRDQLNIIKAHQFIGDYNINPDDSIIDEKIVESINENFERDINLIGFGTDFGEDKEIPLDYQVTHNAHCDTSIALTVPELLGHYYKYGRTFFLDKIESDKGILMVSNINDEIYYLKRVCDIKKDAYNELDNLIELKETLKEKYNNYLNMRERRRQ